MTHRDSPIAKDVPPGWQDTVLHARLTVGDTVLMASDSPPEYYQKPRASTYRFTSTRPRRQNGFLASCPKRQRDNAD